MLALVTHIGSYVIPDIIAAGHQVVALAGSEAYAAGAHALGDNTRRRELCGLQELKATADSKGLIHLGCGAELHPSDGIAARIPEDEGVLPGYFGFLAAAATARPPRTQRQALGGNPIQSGQIENLDSGSTFRRPAGADGRA